MKNWANFTIESKVCFYGKPSIVFWAKYAMSLFKKSMVHPYQRYAALTQELICVKLYTQVCWSVHLTAWIIVKYRGTRHFIWQIGLITQLTVRFYHYSSGVISLASKKYIHTYASVPLSFCTRITQMQFTGFTWFNRFR